MKVSGLELKPKQGSFPVDQIRSHLEALDHVAVDPVTKSLYMMEPPGGPMRVNLEYRDETGHFGACTIVKVEPESVELLQVMPENVDYCRAFTQWMLDRFECFVYGTYGHDITDRVHGDASTVFPPPKAT